MKTIVKFILFMFIAMCGQSRTWTSTDGRTMEAEIVSTGEDFVVLRLDANKATATVKYSSLIAADVEYAKKFGTVLKDNITLVINKFPKLEYGDDEASRQLLIKYEGFVKIMTPATAKAMSELIRKRLPDDVKYWRQEFERPIPEPRVANIQGKDMKQIREELQAKAAASKKKTAQIKANYEWLSKSLPKWLDEVEKAAP